MLHLVQKPKYWATSKLQQKMSKKDPFTLSNVRLLFNGTMETSTETESWLLQNWHMFHTIVFECALPKFKNYSARVGSVCESRLVGYLK